MLIGHAGQKDLAKREGWATVSSGTESWQPKSLPDDPDASRMISEWVSADMVQPLEVATLDLRGADLSGGDFTGAWFTSSVLAGVPFAHSDLYRAHLEAADLSGTDLTGACCIKAIFDGAIPRSASFEGADLSGASLSGVDARSASFRGARFGDSSLIQVDLRGADLSNTTFIGSSFNVLVDDQTSLHGMTGSLFGPATFISGGHKRRLDGTELESWLAKRGARVEVLRPGGYFSRWTYYARIQEDFPRERPSGIVRRRLVKGVTVDEAFTRNLRWEPTEYLRRYELGHNDVDHVEITQAEADSFVERISLELGDGGGVGMRTVPAAALLRAPRECGSWAWELEGRVPPGLAPALATAGRMTEVLSKIGLLAPAQLECGWYVHGRGGIGITSILALNEATLLDPLLIDRIAGSRPTGFPTAEVFDIRVLGPGRWLDGDGREHREANLVDVTVTPSPSGHAAELSVHHDIWCFYDFSGRPHPDVQSRNAPRLAAAVEQLDAALGVAAIPGEPTYFGTAEGYGIKTPSPFHDGLGPDLTDKLGT